MDFLTEFQAVWDEWGALVSAIGITLAAVASAVYLLSKIGKYLRQLGSAIWQWKARRAIFGMCRRGRTLYRMRRAKSAMRRRLGEVTVRIGTRDYEACLGDDPARSTLSRMVKVAPSTPSWLNDYYVATALESLANEGEIVKAKRYPLYSWPPTTELYLFARPPEGKSALDETIGSKQIPCASHTRTCFFAQDHPGSTLASHTRTCFFAQDHPGSTLDPTRRQFLLARQDI